jgi:hypothetical protein
MASQNRQSAFLFLGFDSFLVYMYLNESNLDHQHHTGKVRLLLGG